MDTVERIQAGHLFAEVPRGLFLIRGENVVLLGEVVRTINLLLICPLLRVSEQIYLISLGS